MIPDGWTQNAWRATCPLICFEIVCWHSANRVRRQFGLVQPPSGPPKNLGNSHNRDLGRGGNWATTHKDWIRYWNSRRRRLEVGEQAMSFIMSPEYWAWYSEELATGYIYLSASMRHTDVATVEIPSRFNEWRMRLFPQLSHQHLGVPLPYPGHDWAPERRGQEEVEDSDDDGQNEEDEDRDDEEDNGDDAQDDDDDDDDDDGGGHVQQYGDHHSGQHEDHYGSHEDRNEERRPQYDHHSVSRQPPIYGNILQQMGLINIQWPDWSSTDTQPTQYVGWDADATPSDNYLLTYEPHEGQNFGSSHHQDIGFTADFGGSFIPSQSSITTPVHGSNEASSSRSTSKKKKKNKEKRVSKQPDRFSHSKYQ